MKKLLIIGLFLASVLTAHALPVCSIALGCTGTSSTPSNGQVLMGSGGRYILVNSSSISSNLTPSNFATTSVSQWSNDSGYITATSTGLNQGVKSVASTSDITVSKATGTNVGFTFLSHNISQFTNNSSYLTTSTNLGVTNFATTSVGQWANNGLYLTTSTGLSTSNFTSANLSLWTNNLNWIQSSSIVWITSSSVSGISPILWSSATGSISCPTCLTTSTGLSTNNFINANISQWTNNSSYLTAATAPSYATGTVAATWTAIQTFNTTSTFNATAKFASSTATKCARFDANQNLVSATGDCPAGDTTGAGAQGTVTTSTVVTANYFPFWTTTNGTSLTGTSTLFLSGFSLFTGGSFNASGTITQNGVNVLTTSTGLGVTNFGSTNISQWTNNSNFVTDSSVSSTYTAQGSPITTRNLIVASSGPLMSFAVSGNTLTATSISTATILTGYTPTTALSSYATSTVAITWTALDTHNSTTTNNSSTVLAGSVSSTVASKLWSSGADGVLVGYAGNSCAVGSLVTSISAAGVVSCNTTSSILTGYVTSTAFLAQGTTINAQTLTMATSGAPLISITVAGTTATFTHAATSTILAGYTTTAGLPSYATSTVAGNWTTTQQFSLASSTQTISASTTLNGMTTMTASIHTGTSTFKGLLNTTGTLDTLVTSGCGTGASIQGSAGRGWVKTGSTASSTCSVAYSTPFPATGSSTCIMTPQASSSAPFIVISSSTGFTIRTLSSTMMVSNTFGYWCFGVY